MLTIKNPVAGLFVKTFHLSFMSFSFIGKLFGSCVIALFVYTMTLVEAMSHLVAFMSRSLNSKTKKKVSNQIVG